jgi:hypothetical protein
MQQLRLQFLMVLGTVLLFLAVNRLNEWLFVRFEFTEGINWVFLPAGVRLLSTLMFGTAGAIGLFIASILLNFLDFAYADPMRSIVGALAASVGPYLVYLYAERAYGLHSSLVNLTPKRLLFLILFCSAASPAIHHVWFAMRGDGGNLLHSYVAMMVGDLNGTLLVIYAMKWALRPLSGRGGAGRDDERPKHFMR